MNIYLLRCVFLRWNLRKWQIQLLMCSPVYIIICICAQCQFYLLILTCWCICCILIKTVTIVSCYDMSLKRIDFISMSDLYFYNERVYDNDNSLQKYLNKNKYQGFCIGSGLSTVKHLRQVILVAIVQWLIVVHPNKTIILAAVLFQVGQFGGFNQKWLPYL